MNWKRPARIAIAVFAITIVALAIHFSTNPAGAVPAANIQIVAQNFRSNSIIATCKVTNNGQDVILYNHGTGPLDQLECIIDGQRTNFQIGYFTGGGWIRPGESKFTHVRIPIRTDNFRVSSYLDPASPRVRLGVACLDQQMSPRLYTALGIFSRILPDRPASDSGTVEFWSPWTKPKK